MGGSHRSLLGYRGICYTANIIMSEIPNITIESSQKPELERLDVVIDLFRHGKALYSLDFKRDVEQMGYRFENCFKDSEVVDDNDLEHGRYEGEITPEGEAELRRTIRKIIGDSHTEEEKILAFYSERERATHTTRIIIDELSRNNVNVESIKQKDLPDLKDIRMQVIDLMKYVKSKDPDSVEPWTYWSHMDRKELEDNHLEGMEHIKKRMFHFLRVMEKYARRYNDQIMGAGFKKLRVIAVTHDVNILSLLSKFGISKENIKTGGFFELTKDGKGNFQPMPSTQ